MEVRRAAAAGGGAAETNRGFDRPRPRSRNAFSTAFIDVFTTARLLPQALFFWRNIMFFDVFFDLFLDVVRQFGGYVVTTFTVS